MKHFVIVGLGSIGRRHASNLAALYPDARFTVVRHGGGIDDFCGRLDARVVTDLAEVLSDSIDLAVLATPSANHIASLPALIDKACPLLVEKPIVTDLSHCEEVERALRRAAPAVRAAGFNLRHLPSLVLMKQFVEDGSLGQIVRGSFTAGQWLPDWRPDTEYRTGYSADRHRGGGVELDLSHEFDAARWFLGELSVEFARTGRFSDLQIDSSDTAIAVLSPVEARCPVITVSLDYVSRQRVRHYELVGDRGSLEWSLDGVLDLVTADGRLPLSNTATDFEMAVSYVNMIRGVMDAIESGDDSKVQTLNDGIASTRLALDVRDQGGSA